jgi:hypothetical protein
MNFESRNPATGELLGVYREIDWLFDSQLRNPAEFH